MGMVLPELFAKISQASAAIVSKAMNKHKDLIVWRKKPSILEFGFADGYSSKTNLAPLIPQYYSEFVGIDITPSMVEFAKKNIKMPRSEFCVLDITTKDLPNDFHNRFDNIFSFLTLHMVLDPRQALKSVFKMLKDGGQTYQIFFKYMPSDPAIERMSRHPKWRKYSQEKMLSPYYHEADPKEFYESDLKAAGFKNFKFEVDENLTYEYPTEEMLRGQFIAVNKTIAYIPEEELEEYNKQYMKEVYDHCLVRTPDNKLVFPRTIKYTLYTICAEKS